MCTCYGNFRVKAKGVTYERVHTDIGVYMRVHIIQRYMIITPNFKTRSRPIPSDSDDDHMAGSPKTPKEYSVSDSDEDHMAGSPKTPQKGRIEYSGNNSNDELAELLNEIAKDCLEDDVHFCDFANDNYKCYRNSLLWVLLSCDMILETIRKHKNDAQGPPCSEFDDFLLQLCDKCQQNTRISIDSEFMNSSPKKKL